VGVSAGEADIGVADMKEKIGRFYRFGVVEVDDGIEVESGVDEEMKRLLYLEKFLDGVAG